MNTSIICILVVLDLFTTSLGQTPAIENVERRLIKLKFDLGLGDEETISTSDEVETLTVDTSLDIPQIFEPGASALNVGFVKPNGTRLAIDGKPFYCAGTNAYYAALKWLMSDNEVGVMMREHAKYGVTAMRVFAHSNFNSVPAPTIMPRFGVYNETALQRLDLLLYEAAQTNIRLILVLSNHWNFLGGSQQWVNNAFGTGLPLELFYQNQTLIDKFKDFVGTIVTRTNTLTGQRYIDDPTIMAWELVRVFCILD